MGKRVDRLSLLKDVLKALLYWRGLLPKEVFSNALENHLAFRGEQVEIRAEGIPTRTGQIKGLEQDGSLRLRSGDRQTFTVRYGEVHLHPVL